MGYGVVDSFFSSYCFEFRLLVFTGGLFWLLVFFFSFFWLVEKGGGDVGGGWEYGFSFFFLALRGFLMALTLLDFYGFCSLSYYPFLFFFLLFLPFQRGLLSSSRFLSIFFVLSCLSPFLRPKPPLKTKSFNPAFHFSPKS